MLEESGFVIFGKSVCEYCIRARELLESLGISYVYNSVDDPKALFEMQELVYDKTGIIAKTVPQIFNNWEYVGGYTELEKLLQ